MSVAHLYKITHQPSGRYYYGKHNGTTQQSSGQKYWGSGKAITALVKKYGTDNLTYDILCISTPEYILDLESKIVTENLLEDKLCLNLCVGGFGGPMQSEDRRKAHSQRMKGRMVGDLNPSKREDVRAKLRGREAWNAGINYHYVDGIRVDGKKLLEDKEPYDRSGINNPFYGKEHREETKKKISEKKSGRKMSQEFCDRRSELMSGENNPKYGTKLSAEHIALLAESRAKAPKYECIHCKQMFMKQYITRYHNDKCKMKENN
jgi:hypothetical protein